MIAKKYVIIYICEMIEIIFNSVQIAKIITTKLFHA